MTKMLHKWAAMRQWRHYNFLIECCYLLIAAPGILNID